MSTPLVTGCSPLATYYKDAKYYDRSGRTVKIDTITIHCIVGQLTAKGGCDFFANITREASCNYVVGTDGSIGISVPEGYRSYCTSNGSNDNRAVTIETASDTFHPYAVNDIAYNALIKLIADICKRNSIKKLVWSTNKDDRVNHRNGCNMTVHRDYAAKSCPGQYLYERHGDIAAKVNSLLVPTVSSCKANLQEINSTSIKALIKVSDEYNSYNWSYRVTNLGNNKSTKEAINLKSKEYTLLVNNLIPNNSYSLELIAKNSTSELVFYLCSFTTTQDYPKSVENVNIKCSGNDSLDYTYDVTFDFPSSWGSYAANRKERGYRFIIIVNGKTVYSNDNLIAYNKNNIIFKLSDLIADKVVNYMDTVQIGIQTWIKDENKIPILDADYPTCSNPIWLEPILPLVDKIHLCTNNKLKRTIIYCRK